MLLNQIFLVFLPILASVSSARLRKSWIISYFYVRSDSCCLQSHMNRWETEWQLESSLTLFKVNNLNSQGSCKNVGNGTTVCMALKNCPSLLKTISPGQITSEAVRKLQKLTCGFDRDDPRVIHFCCYCCCLQFCCLPFHSTGSHAFETWIERTAFSPPKSIIPNLFLSVLRFAVQSKTVA